jgi:hypothetical protein
MRPALDQLWRANEIEDIVMWRLAMGDSRYVLTLLFRSAFISSGVNSAVGFAPGFCTGSVLQ